MPTAEAHSVSVVACTIVYSYLQKQSRYMTCHDIDHLCGAEQIEQLQRESLIGVKSIGTEVALAHFSKRRLD